MITWLPRPVLPVLMYHRLGASSSGDPALWIPIERFRRQMTWLRDRGFRTLSLDGAYAAFRRRRCPRRAVLLTFDDGFAETLERALPILAASETRAAVFVAADQLGRDVELAGTGAGTGCSGRIADRELLRAWQAAGHAVGAHARTHLALVGRDQQTLERETTGAKRLLEDLLQTPILDFCYPYALHDDASRRQVIAAGYRAAYAGEPPTLDLFALPRMMVYPQDDWRRFRRKLSGYYYWLAGWHRRLVGARGD